MSSTSSRMPWSIWTVHSGWHWRHHWQWTSITLETTVQGRWRKPRWLGPLVSPSPIVFLASRGPTGCSGVVRTAISRHIFQWRYSVGIKLEGLLGWQICMGMSQSSCLYSIIRNNLSNGPFALLNCHWVSSEVGCFSNPCACSCEEEYSISSLVWFRPSSTECLP